MRHVSPEWVFSVFLHYHTLYYLPSDYFLGAALIKSEY